VERKIFTVKRRNFLLLPTIAPAILKSQTEEGFTSLFDGATLRGWTIQEGPQSAFYVKDGAIEGTPSSDFPAWLRSEKEYENFDFRCEFFVRGWTDGGVYVHAPEHGRNTWIGMEVKIFHQQDKEPRPNSMGSIFPLIAPSKVNVRNRGEWNSLRIVSDWPRFQVWVNGERVQDLDVTANPELRYRLRRGYLGLNALGYPLRFRNLRIRELPGKDKWESLFETDTDLAKNWVVSESNPKAPVRFEAFNGVLVGNGSGHIATREQYSDFQLHLYIRGPKHHNGGVLFRSSGQGLASKRHYEIQLHNVEDAHYPTGSLYYFKRAIYPRIEDEKWYLLQLVVQGKNCLVRINGENVLEYDELQNLDEGHIELQAHQPGTWIEYKHIRVKRI
jgi:hypothetical protein